MRFLTYADLDVPKRLRPSFDKTRAAVERDDFFSVDMKKLKGHAFFRAKLDYDSRLIVQFVSYNGQKACLALEVVESHAYDKSRFLRGARVHDTDGCESDSPDAAALESAASPVKYLHPTRTDFHVLDKLLSFDDRQDALMRLPMPVVLVGCAGSGKTALTLSKLRALTGKILYVTESAYLAESSAALYYAHGYENESQSVDFLSYRSLLESVRVPSGRAVQLRDFVPFFRRHEAGFKFTQAQALFEELRGVLTAHVDGPLSLDAYLELGVRQSIYDAGQRRVVHAFLSKYVVWLRESKLYDTNLVAHEYLASAEKTYDAVVVDEVQDLTNAELALVLAMLKKPDAFLLCGDANQIVHPNFFSWAKVKSLFYRREVSSEATPVRILDVNYRSSRAVCQAANSLLKVKHARFGSVDRESTALVHPASDTEGRVVGVKRTDSLLRTLNERTRQSTDVAVIVLSEERKAEARQKFSTPLVFSVHEAKGLEYGTVILYDVVSSERARYAEVAAGVAVDDLAVTELQFGRANERGDKSLEVYKFFVNALYVALTRAVDTLYVVESDAQHALLALLGISCGDDLNGLQAKISTTEDWAREARKLEMQGKQEQADAIRKQVLRLTPVPWPVMDRASFVQAYDRAFLPNTPYPKAKQQIFDFGLFHRADSLPNRLMALKFQPANKDFAEHISALRERTMGAYVRGVHTDVLRDVERYGVEYRSPMGLTPLMMAADVGDVPLVEALLQRGAQVEAVDSLGRMPVHFALYRAFHEPEFAKEKLGALYELLCPTSIGIEVDGRRERLGRDQGEFALLLFFVARFHMLYRETPMRREGFQAWMVDETELESFPGSVVSDARKRRTYWNGVLARGEVQSKYRPARKLWVRQRQGHYLPSGVGIRVASPSGAEDIYVPLDELLQMVRLDGPVWAGRYPAKG